MAKFVLDTNIFYKISENPQKRNKRVRDLQEIKENLILTPMNILEIANCDGSNEDYYKRKRAMSVLEDIGANIYLDSSDEVISKAYGVPVTNKFTNDELRRIVFALCNSKSFSDLKNGVDDIENRRTIKLNIELLNEWKKKARSFFNQKVINGNRDIQMEIKQKIEVQDSSMGKKLFRGMKRKEIIKAISSISVYAYMIIGLAERSGLIQANVYEEICNNFDVVQFESTLSVALEHYDDSLEDYITTYLIYRYKTLYGKHPEKNDLFDLEFFAYLNVIEDSKFVTGENLWTIIDSEYQLGKVMSYNTFQNEFM